MGVIIRQSIKATASNYIGTLLGFLSLFLLFPLFFEPTDLGAVRFLLEAAAVLSTFALMGTHYSINRFFPYFKTEDRRNHGFFFWVFVLPATGYLLVLTGLLFFREPLLALFRMDAQKLEALYPMLILLVLFSLFQVVTESASANHGRIAVPNFLREIFIRVCLIASGFAFFRGWIEFETALWLMVAAYGLAVAGNILFLSRLTPIHLKPDFNFLKEHPELRKEMLRFTGFLFLGGVTGLIISKLDFMMITSMKNLSDTAIYSIGFYLAMLIEIPKRTLLQVSAPIISSHMKEGNLPQVQDLYRRTTLNQLLAGATLFYLIWLNIDNLYDIMPRGDYYRSGKIVVLILGVGRLFDLLGSSSGPVLANSKYYAWTFVNFGIVAVLAVVGNYLLIPIYGITGAAIATSLTIMVNHILVIYITWLKMGIHPFDRGQLRLLLIMIPMFALTLIPYRMENPFLNGILRTGTAGLLFVYLLYAFKVSEDMNEILKRSLGRFGIRLK